MSNKDRDNELQEPSVSQNTDLDRRRLLKHGGVAAGGLAAFAAGYGDTLYKAAKGLTRGTAGVPTADSLRGNSLKPEFSINAKGELSAANGQIVSP